MPDRSASIRHWQLIRTLSASRNGCSLRALAEEYCVSEKTIRRDLTAIECGGLSLMETTEEHGRKRWRLERSSDLPAPAFDVSKVAALYLGRRFLEPLAGTHLWDAAQSAFVKLRQFFRPAAVRYMESLARSIHEIAFGQSDYSDRTEVIDRLVAGITDATVTRALYHPLRRETPREYVLHPLGLVWNRGRLYLVAATPERPEPRHYKVDRIRDLEVLRDKFEFPANFDLADHLQDTLGIYQQVGPLQQVCICFAEPVARYVREHRWHHSQDIKEQPDGRLIVELQLSDLTELKSWILGFGLQAIVLAPDSLRDAVRRELAASLSAYAEVDSSRESVSIEGPPA